MKIKRISAWRVVLPLYEGSYKWARGKSVNELDSTIVGVESIVNMFEVKLAAATTHISNIMTAIRGTKRT